MNMVIISCGPHQGVYHSDCQACINALDAYGERLLYEQNEAQAELRETDLIRSDADISVDLLREIRDSLARLVTLAEQVVKRQAE